MPGLVPFTLGFMLTLARAGVLTPEWSRPLGAAVVSTTVGARTFSTQELFVLLDDGRVLPVSAADTLRQFGRVPQGATALMSLPAPARGASDIALMLAACPRPGVCNLMAWNRNGQQLWSTAVPGMTRIDSCFFVDDGENRAEFCAWQRGEPWLVVVEKKFWQYSVRATGLRPGFTPRDALACDLDRDGVPELAFSDGVRLTVCHTEPERELRCQWPGQDSAPDLGSAGREPRPRLACAVFDTSQVLLIVTGDTLRFVNAMTGEEERKLASDPSALPGAPAAVAACSSTVYAAGVDRQGRCYLARLVPSGPIHSWPALPLADGARVNSLGLLKGWPMLLVSSEQGAQRLFVYAPGLAGTPDHSPGYGEVSFIRLV